MIYKQEKFLLYERSKQGYANWQIWVKIRMCSF